MPKSNLVIHLLATLVLLAVGPSTALADAGEAHRERQARPILLGTSGGSASDLDGAFCCGGTLGGLVQDAQGALYLVSNNHVLGRTNRASAGEDTVQPALIDSGCRAASSDVVADFSELIAIDFGGGENRVDAAIARVRADLVVADGSLLDIGTPATEVVEPFVGMRVQKSGRTTGYTTGEIVATDVSVLVSYPKKCGGGGGPAALMVDQVRISDASFSDAGDSGSLVLEDASNPRAVGLLFAGSSTSTIANRIRNVLEAGWSVGPLAMAGGDVTGCGSDFECDDSDPCTNDACLASGACAHTLLDCDDGDACTADQCVNGSCAHPPIACDDGDACTQDSCVAASGCVFEPLEGCTQPCGDGVCEIGAGEDCVTCAADCNGITKGRRSDRFCCGVDADCSDPRCGGGGSCVQGGSAGSVDPISPTLAHARDAQRRDSARLFSIPEVVGHGLGRDVDGAPVIEVYLARKSDGARAAIPRTLEGVAVRVLVTGRFVAN